VEKSIGRLPGMADDPVRGARLAAPEAVPWPLKADPRPHGQRMHAGQDRQKPLTWAKKSRPEAC
jgi:hypothetical protein